MYYVTEESAQIEVCLSWYVKSILIVSIGFSSDNLGKVCTDIFTQRRGLMLPPVCLSQEQYQFLYDTVQMVFPVQNGEVKAVQASAADSIQVISETAAAEQPDSAASSQQQEAAESTRLVAEEDNAEEPGKESSLLGDTSSVPLEVWGAVAHVAEPFPWGDLCCSSMLSFQFLHECIETVKLNVVQVLTC